MSKEHIHMFGLINFIACSNISILKCLYGTNEFSSFKSKMILIAPDFFMRVKIGDMNIVGSSVASLIMPLDNIDAISAVICEDN